MVWIIINSLQSNDSTHPTAW